MEPVARDEDACRVLIDQAARHVRTASAGIGLGDSEGGLQLAYDACRKTCLALILAIGLRPKDEQGSHAVTFEAAAAIAANFGARDVVGDAGRLRYVRHGVEYRAGVVHHADAEDAVSLAEELLDSLSPQVTKLLDHPPPYRSRRA
ncbi:hypothetical protein N5079_12560 [Planotetraspora sp. A-T 1434]|uniref:hypothetical protein n=1 Tax=Planotetraspora sp. A-T 1434 TaxID=2979219 RepID=UPI0021C0C266|nr:hypothetical protein [Planotetraspora sp. A-T 1434]MCT9931047.1 hypothetical protein [Planotetraspora sp. A-T 1434]